MSQVIISETKALLTGNNFPKIEIWLRWFRDNIGVDVDVDANEENIRGRAFLIKTGTASNGSTSNNLNGDCSASVSADIDTDAPLEVVFEADDLNYDWRSPNNAPDSIQLLWDGWITVAHDPDGSKTMAFSATWTGDTNLGSRTISGSVLLPKITALPGVPSSVTATRVSDSEIDLSWSISSPSNGAATSIEYRKRDNGGAWSSVTSISPTTTVRVATAANRKTEYQVRARNAAGATAWSSTSAPVYTTPAAPTGLTATKDASLDINLAWVKNAAYSEHEQLIEHSTDNGATWSPLVTLSSSATTYKHDDPNPAQTHRYRISARSTTGSLTSDASTSANVQLLAAPAKPTLPDLPDYAARERSFVLPWTHNPVDTTPQTAYEVERSTNAGSSWTSTGKQTSTSQQHTYADSTFAADTSVMVRVRTWGQATTGGADGTGASAWSDPQTVVFKSAPVATILSPTDGATLTNASLAATLGFSQAQGATFVQATVVLSQTGIDLETVVSGSLADIAFTTPVLNGEDYTITATVRDSNGVESDPVESDFDVAYTLPVAAGVVLTFLRETGAVQIDLTIPAAGGGFAAATAVTITRAIDGAVETLYTNSPVDDDTLTFFDTTAILLGDNAYVVRTISALGAINDVPAILDPAEGEWAYISTGPGYSTIIAFASNLRYSTDPSRESELVEAAGRTSPIALFGTLEKLLISGSATIWAGEGSTVKEVVAFLRKAGLVCYRDPSGNRIFGRVTGTLETPWSEMSQFQYTITEAT